MEPPARGGQIPLKFRYTVMKEVILWSAAFTGGCEVWEPLIGERPIYGMLQVGELTLSLGLYAETDITAHALSRQKKCRKMEGKRDRK